MAGGVKRTLLFAVASLLLLAVITGVGLLRFPEGRGILIRTSCSVRSSLIATPIDERGLLWHARDKLTLVTVELPLFVIGFEGDRAKLFAAARAHCGLIATMKDGITYSSHELVSSVMSAEVQRRGPYIGAQVMPGECFHRDTLIFQSTGEKHSKTREFLHRAIHAFSADRFDPIRLPEGVTRLGASSQAVDRTVVMNLFMRMFGEWPSESDTDTMVEYFVYGGSCVLGPDFHRLTFNVMLGKVKSIREQVRDVVARTPTGQRVLSLAAEDGMSEEEAQLMLVQVVDGFLFAGMFGTTHLAGHTLARIRSDPIRHVPLWQQSPRSYLLEQARVDPPVTSVTAVLDAPDTVTLSLFPESPVTLPAGTTVQLLISNANTDPDVFGGDQRSAVRAREFDPARSSEELDKILSFNGLEGFVRAGKAPRGCVGHNLALRLAEDIVEAFLPTEEEIELFHTTYREGEEADLIRIAQEATHADYALYDAALRGQSDFVNVFDEIGFAAWLLCCAASFCYLRLFGSNTTAVYHYSFYLVGQMWVCIGFLIPSVKLPLFFIGQIVAASAYGGLYMQVRGYSSLAQWTMLFVCFAYFGVVVSVSQLFGYTFPIPVLQAICTALYTPMAMLGLLLLTRLAVQAGDGFTWGMVGGWMGVFNLFWPYLFPAELFHLLSRISDSLFYVPLVLGTICRMMTPEEREAHKRNAETRYSKRRISLSTPGFGLSSLHVSIALVLIAVAAISQQSIYGWATGDACPFVDRDTASAYDLKSCSYASDALVQTDFYIQLLFKVLKMQHRDEKLQVNSTNEISKNISKPWYTGTLPKKHLHFGVTAPVVDPEDCPVETIGEAIGQHMEDAFDWVLRTIPFQDVDVEWESLEHARRAMRVVSKGDVPLPSIEWDEVEGGVTGEEAISFMAFAGIASHRLVRRDSAAYGSLPTSLQRETLRLDATFVSDFSWMSALDMRQGFEPYGATAFFRDTGDLIAIYWPYRNATLQLGDREWEHAKWVYRSSAVSGVTVRDHLVGVHLMLANFLATASAEALAPDHPIRMLLRPFTYRTFRINRGATTYLCEKNGLLHRAVGLSFLGLKQAMKYSFSTLRYADLETVVQAQGIGGLNGLHSWADDTIDFHRLVASYVSSYVDLYYPDSDSVLADEQLLHFAEHMRRVPQSHIPPIGSKSSLKDLLSSYILHVTALHSHVGNVAEYLMDARFSTAKLRSGREVADVQASYQAMGIALLTGWKVPALLDDFSHLTLDDGHREEVLQLMETFQRSLEHLADEVEARNAKRRFPTNGINPRRMHASVSI